MTLASLLVHYCFVQTNKLALGWNQLAEKTKKWMLLSYEQAQQRMQMRGIDCAPNEGHLLTVAMCAQDLGDQTATHIK